MHKYRKISNPSGHTADKQTYIGDDLCGRVSYAVASFTYRERERERERKREREREKERKKERKKEREKRKNLSSGARRRHFKRL